LLVKNKSPVPSRHELCDAKIRNDGFALRSRQRSCCGSASRYLVARSMAASNSSPSPGEQREADQVRPAPVEVAHQRSACQDR